MKKKIIIRDKESFPPATNQLDHINKIEASIIANKKHGDDNRIAVEVSPSLFVLCEPEERDCISGISGQLSPAEVEEPTEE